METRDINALLSKKDGKQTTQRQNEINTQDKTLDDLMEFLSNQKKEAEKTHEELVEQQKFLKSLELEQQGCPYHHHHRSCKVL